MRKERRAFLSLLLCALTLSASLAQFIADGPSQTCTNSGQRAVRIFYDGFESGNRETYDGMTQEYTAAFGTTDPPNPESNFYLGPLRNNLVEVNFMNLPNHTEIEVAFDLITSGSWDGTSGSGAAANYPDLFEMRIQEATVFSESFCTNLLSVVTDGQSFPPGSSGLNTCQTGGSPGSGQLPAAYTGYQYSGSDMDNRYRIGYRSAHTRTDFMDIEFEGNLGGTDSTEERWLIDDLEVWACIDDDGLADDENDDDRDDEDSGRLSPIIVGLLVGSGVVVIGGAVVFWGRNLNLPSNEENSKAKVKLVEKREGDHGDKRRQTGMSSATAVSEVIPRVQRDATGAPINDPVSVGPAAASKSTPPDNGTKRRDSGGKKRKGSNAPGGHKTTRRSSAASSGAKKGK